MGVTVKSSVNIGLKTGYSVLVTVAAGFVGIQISAALRCLGDYVLGLYNFNSYYDPTLKRARFIIVLEVCKNANPQPAIVWVSSSSVYGLNTEDFGKKIELILYAATKKAAEEIAHTYNHIYGLSLTGLRFFTVYGPWGRPDMAYFFFSKDILKRKSIPIFESSNHGTAARDFTFIDDVVKGCLGALDATEKSIGSGGKKKRGGSV
ncbi:putative UDP-glucuronate 4-epimerase [Helianthus annuus]|uniref:Putative bifunctional polymyxin resistance protein, ArnA n=1 Tax=Helianthus annuus TaxID=4232 RepID=A0A1Y3BXR5_HELAN|nr:putative UDP-glucuronate 4-epimerase [Helianthus annuus]